MLNTKILVTSAEHQKVGWRLINKKTGVTKVPKDIYSRATPSSKLTYKIVEQNKKQNMFKVKKKDTRAMSTNCVHDDWHPGVFS